ncbi:DUF932 domain-containing protein [Belliella aquatica]|uniref:DUF932 domain-containing protein n=1 Tax=Belliella aquatica TaxID=1323734 RepID=A0ABQ1M604_9BACT|nr:DUF932 domain-containing protein [Belliella aquatica]MCH7404637.1 DUF932 domain-containing protein [Belliella aquatica]GGC35313.1 hypothetical protein GCM10010993_12790 [Belliella aquatica]
MGIIIKPISSELDWEIQTERLFNKNGHTLKNYKMLTRSDNGALLNVCKRSYTPTPNMKFKDVVESMIKITGMEFHGFSEFQGGKKIIAYLKSDRRKIAGFDFDNYMVIGNSHDYSTGFFIASSHTMLRCENQFSRMYKGRAFSIPHTAAIDARIDDLILSFETYMEEQRRLERKLTLWKEIDVDPILVEMMIERVLNIELGNEDSIGTRKKNKIESLSNSLKKETGDIGNNLMGLFQGVTHFTTHVYSQKEKVFGNIFGTVAELNNRAFGFAETIEYGMVDNIDLGLN